MTGFELAGWCGLALVGLALSASFSGVETGLYTINRVRLTVRASSGDRRATRLLAELERPSRLLATILIGNNIANYCGSFGVAAILDSVGLGPAQAVAVNALILVPMLFIFGETLPKDLFRTHTDRWTYSWSGFIAAVGRVLTYCGLLPLVMSVHRLLARWLGSEATGAVQARQRISQLIKEGVGAGVLSEQQTSLVDRALSLRDRSVGSEMVPWRRVVWLHADAPPGSRDVILAQPFTRVPVVNGNGKVVGIVSSLDLVLQPTRPTRELMTAALELPSDTPVRAALRRMRAAQTPIAIVIDRRRSPIGLVTLKDLVEPLVGELSAW